MRARARANHARNDAQKGCVMQLKGITLRLARTTEVKQSKAISKGFQTILWEKCRVILHFLKPLLSQFPRYLKNNETCENFATEQKSKGFIHEIAGVN